VDEEREEMVGMALEEGMGARLGLAREEREETDREEGREGLEGGRRELVEEEREGA